MRSVEFVARVSLVIGRSTATKSHHTMNAMGHQVKKLYRRQPQGPRPKPSGKLVPDYMAMGASGMAEMGEMEMPMPTTRCR